MAESKTLFFLLVQMPATTSIKPTSYLSIAPQFSLSLYTLNT
jgi:hypothetical protein